MKHLKLPLRPQAIFSMLVLLSLLMACSAQQPSEKIYSIGIITIAPFDEMVESFKVSMAEQGYVEGKNINYIYDGPVGTPENLGPAIQKMIDLRVDAILSLTTTSTKVVKAATSSTKIPVVFSVVVDPVAAGIIDSLASPSGNITGVSMGLVEGPRLDWLKQIVPDLERVYVPYNPKDTAATLSFQGISAAAATLGITVVPREISTVEDVDAAIRDIPTDVDAIVMPSDITVKRRLEALAQAAIERKLPLTTPSDIQLGGLMVYGLDYTLVGQQIARQMLKVLGGTDPGAIPVETAEFLLQLNLKTAQAIDMQIPDSIIQQARIVVR